MGERKHMDAESFRAALAPFRGVFLTADELKLTDAELQDKDAEALVRLVEDRALDLYGKKEQALGAPLMRELERVMMLRVVDEYWMDHLDNMTELRQGIGLRAYGQEDPVVAYKREGYEMFEEMIAAIQEETVRRVFVVQVRVNNGQGTVERKRVAKVTGTSGGGDGSVKQRPTVHKGVKIGRNDPCPCGSGLKWKKCTCKEYHPD